MWPQCAGTASVSGTKRRKVGPDAQPPSAEQEVILWTVNMEECRVKLRWGMRFKHLLAMMPQSCLCMDKAARCSAWSTDNISLVYGRTAVHGKPVPLAIATH